MRIRNIRNRRCISNNKSKKIIVTQNDDYFFINYTLAVRTGITCFFLETIPGKNAVLFSNLTE